MNYKAEKSQVGQPACFTIKKSKKQQNWCFEIEPIKLFILLNKKFKLPYSSIKDLLLQFQTTQSKISFNILFYPISHTHFLLFILPVTINSFS